MSSENRQHTRRVRGRPGLGTISHFCTVHEDSEGRLLAEARLSTSIPESSRVLA
jgi:hypothetical protein